MKTAKAVWRELRLYVAEILAGWIIEIAPTDSQLWGNVSEMVQRLYGGEAE